MVREAVERTSANYAGVLPWFPFPSNIHTSFFLTVIIDAAGGWRPEKTSYGELEEEEEIHGSEITVRPFKLDVRNRNTKMR